MGDVVVEMDIGTAACGVVVDVRRKDVDDIEEGLAALGQEVVLDIERVHVVDLNVGGHLEAAGLGRVGTLARDLHQQVDRLAAGRRGNPLGDDVEGDGKQVGLPLDHALACREVERHVVREDIFGANQHGTVLLDGDQILGEEFERSLVLLVVGLDQLGRHAQRDVDGLAGHVGQPQTYETAHIIAAQLDRRFALAALALEIGFDFPRSGGITRLSRAGKRDVVGTGDRSEGPACSQASGG